MVFTGLLCTISVIVSNVSCLALYSFFASILPTKRNLLTRLNTVLVLAITALVNTQARFDLKMCKVFFKRDSLFAVWRHFDRSYLPTLDLSSNDPGVCPLLARSTLSSRSCCTQPHQDLPDTQGESKRKSRIGFILMFFSSLQSSTSLTMRDGSSKFFSASCLAQQSTLLLSSVSILWLH